MLAARTHVYARSLDTYARRAHALVFIFINRSECERANERQRTKNI